MRSRGSHPGFRASQWALQTLHGNPGPHVGDSLCGSAYLVTLMCQGRASLLPSSQPPPPPPILRLPAQRHWTPICFLPLPSAFPALAQACCPREPPSDPPPATCSPSLSPVWLSVALAGCSLSGVPRWGLGNSWHRWPGPEPGTGCRCFSSPRGFLEERRTGRNLSPPPRPTPAPWWKSGTEELLSLCRKRSSAGLCFNQQ